MSDLQDIGRGREGSAANANNPDPSVAQKLAIIVGGALAFLVMVKLGFLKRVLP